MANLLSLRRQLQVLKVRLKTKRRALGIYPHDQKLGSEIVQLEGEVEETELYIKFAEEDAKSEPRSAADEYHEEQISDPAQYDTALFSSANLTPPDESSNEPADANEYTLQNIHAIKNNKIWDFKNREFVGLDISGDKARCKTLLLDYAKKLFKATYFIEHLCHHDDIESHIPLDKILEVYDKQKWEDALNDVQKKLHERILTTGLLEQIISKEWKNRSTYPKRTSGKIQDEAESALRMEVWMTYANEDIHVLTWFIAPLAESIDWVKIRKAGTANHKTLFHWTQACLVMAAETVFRLGRDELDSETGKRMGGNSSAFKLNREWEKFAKDKEWKSRLEGIPTPVNREFGCGNHTSKKYFPVDLPQGDWSDSESQAGALKFENVSRFPKLIVMTGIVRSRSSKTPSLLRNKRTKPSEMTLDDKARKRRRTKGISESSIFKRRPGSLIEVQDGGDGPGKEVVERGKGEEMKGDDSSVYIKEEPLDDA